VFSWEKEIANKRGDDGTAVIRLYEQRTVRKRKEEVGTATEQGRENWGEQKLKNLKEKREMRERPDSKRRVLEEPCVA